MAARRVRGFQTSVQESAKPIHHPGSESVEFPQFPLISHFRAESLLLTLFIWRNGGTGFLDYNNMDVSPRSLSQIHRLLFELPFFPLHELKQCGYKADFSPTQWQLKPAGHAQLIALETSSGKAFHFFLHPPNDRQKSASWHTLEVLDREIWIKNKELRPSLYPRSTLKSDYFLQVFRDINFCHYMNYPEL